MTIRIMMRIFHTKYMILFAVMISMLFIASICLGLIPTPINKTNTITSSPNLPESDATSDERVVVTKTIGVPATKITILATKSSITPSSSESELPFASSLSRSSLNLEPGQYLIFSDASHSHDLFAKSLKMLQPTVFLKQYDQQLDSIDALTPDGRTLIIKDLINNVYVWDSKHDRLVDLHSIGDCQITSASQNINKLLCMHQGRIFILEDKSVAQIVEIINSEKDYYFYPIWSPDGKWISFFNLWAPFTHDSEDGLYLVAAACPDIEHEDCKQDKRGPFRSSHANYSQGFYAWSPNSKKIAYPTFANPDDSYMQRSKPGIEIYDLETKKVQDLTILGGNKDELIDKLAWSPDGEWIAYSRQDGDMKSYSIYLTPALGGTPIRFINGPEKVSIYFWLIVPISFHPGENYSISKAGANLNLRDQPSLLGNTLHKFYPGELITVISGPVDNDGYEWWRILVGNTNLQGWVVGHPDWFNRIENSIP